MFGTASRSHDPENLFLEKRRDEVFRHRVLGVGVGDLRVQTRGARAEEFLIPSVPVGGAKREAILRLVASQPEAHTR